MHSPHVVAMLRAIDRRYQEPLSLAVFAHDLRRERGYLGRIFKKEVGCSMREYLTRVRVQHAAVLIREGTKIEAAILEVGYRSPKRFYDAFKREFGVTPATFRAQADSVRRGLEQAPPARTTESQRHREKP